MSQIGTKRKYLDTYGISGAEGRPAVLLTWRRQPPLTQSRRSSFSSLTAATEGKRTFVASPCPIKEALVLLPGSRYSEAVRLFPRSPGRCSETLLGCGRSGRMPPGRFRAIAAARSLLERGHGRQ
jgi:hypothetical protein